MESTPVTKIVSRVSVLAFDVFGTVTDWRNTLARECAVIADLESDKVDWQQFAEDWRSGYKPQIDRVRRGERPWAKLDTLHREILESILSRHQLGDLSVEQRQKMNTVWHRLDPWPDAREGLIRLRERFVTTTLSNGNVSLLIDLSRNADLRFDCVLSAEHVRSYKTDKEPYLAACEFLDCEPVQIALVSAHPEDLDGAARAGLTTCFVERPKEWRQRQPAVESYDRADICASDFLELADLLDCPQSLHA